jgi:inosine-uridine nucleoside N-ribohydrolase
VRGGGRTGPLAARDWLNPTIEPVSAPPPARVILDCDPGIDDALAIVFACGHPGLDLAGITTVSGNVDLGKVTGNALSVLELAGCPEVPVASGSAQPLLRPIADARHVHGESGLGAAALPPARTEPVAGHAVDFLIEQIGAAPGEITLVATGPLTNIALAVRREPRLAGWVRDFVIMGGSAGRGNTTPAAEFNIWADPEAAAITFSAGWRVTMVGLDVTLQARATPAVQDRMRPLGRLAADLLLPGLVGYRGEVPTGDPATSGPAVHDVLALALVAEPGLFRCQPARVEVETSGRWTAGMTVTDFDAPADTRNAQVAMSIDVPAFWDVVLSSYRRIPAAGQA